MKLLAHSAIQNFRFHKILMTVAKFKVKQKKTIRILYNVYTWMHLNICSIFNGMKHKMTIGPQSTKLVVHHFWETNKALFLNFWGHHYTHQGDQWERIGIITITNKVHRKLAVILLRQLKKWNYFQWIMKIIVSIFNCYSCLWVAKRMPTYLMELRAYRRCHRSSSVCCIQLQIKSCIHLQCAICVTIFMWRQSSTL